MGEALLKVSDVTKSFAEVTALSTVTVDFNAGEVVGLVGGNGAGKTTLLNHILTNQEGLKTAVLVNEFGEIGIDNELIVSTGEDMIELSNGCICCSINEDLKAAVYGLLEKPNSIDYLIV